MPRTIRTKIYKFEELSADAQQTAIERYRNQGIDHPWADENRESLEAFAAVFPIKIRNWSYGGNDDGVSFYFTDDSIEDLTGQRLATYLWNNYKSELYKPKYYGTTNSTERILHKRIKSILSARSSMYINQYFSAITIERSCPFTGYYMDDILCDEIWAFIDKPDGRTFKELLSDCFYNWIKACNEEIEYQNSDEAIRETIIANEYEFTKDGKRW